MKIVIPFTFICSYGCTFIAGELFAPAFLDKHPTVPEYLWLAPIVAAILCFCISTERERRFTGFDNIRWPPGGVGYDRTERRDES